jgi:Rod binding domain-containing protein
MDITSIVESASFANRTGIDTKSPDQVARVFETMLFELLLKESGLANSLAGGAGKEWSMLGDQYVQILASQLAREMDFGTSRLLAAEQNKLAEG